MLKQSASQKEQTVSPGLNNDAVGVSTQSEETGATKSEVSRKEKKVKGISSYAMANLFRPVVFNRWSADRCQSVEIFCRSAKKLLPLT
jgi:hypothetical protein